MASNDWQALTALPANSANPALPLLSRTQPSHAQPVN